MATITQETRLDLAKRELVAFAKARGQTLDCVEGELWITVEGEAGDLILGRGDTWRIASDAPVTVSALRPSQVRIHRSQAFGSFAEGARRLLFSLRGRDFPLPATLPVHLIR